MFPTLQSRSAFLILAATLLAGAAFAAIPDLVWDSPEVIDSPVLQVSSPNGSSLIHWGGQWRVVYEKEGAICFASRGPAGWSAPVLLTPPGIPSRNPHLASDDEYHAPLLLVLWEDDRAGHSEVWARSFNGAQWSAEQCLSLDAFASRSSAIAGVMGAAFAVWEDSTGVSFRVRGRSFDTTWSPMIEEIAGIPGTGREPAIAADRMLGQWHFVWSDHRDGPGRIYYRTRGVGGGWSGEMPFAEGRRPSVNWQPCCGDMFGLTTLGIAFETEGTQGAVESRGVCYEFGDFQLSNLSTDDGIPSVRPQAGGYPFSSFYCNILGGYAPRFYASWTDVPASGPRQHRISTQCGGPAGQDVLASGGAGTSVFALSEDASPTELFGCWIEDVGGVSSLMGRAGRLPDCIDITVDLAPALWIAPEGHPPNLVRTVDRCTGSAVPHLNVTLHFSPALEAALHWDAGQPHPVITAESDEDGIAVLSIRGGGCSQAGIAAAGCDGDTWLDQWNGAKSPDIDGDCAVRTDDVDYVQSMLGSADFCADLDGSGLVDAADVALVQNALGDICSQLTASPENIASARALTLTAGPNPAARSCVLRIGASRPGSCDLALYDGAGRLVRVYSSISLSPGVTQVEWDLRDSAGRRVPSGIYFAAARVSEKMIRHAVVVLRDED